MTRVVSVVWWCISNNESRSFYSLILKSFLESVATLKSLDYVLGECIIFPYKRAIG